MPLSTVSVWIMPLSEASISTVFVAKGDASFPLSLLIHRKPVRLSIIVNIAPLWFLPMMVSPSRSPNLSFLSAIAGRCSMSTLPAITPLDLYWLPLLAYFRPFRLRRLDSCFPLCLDVCPHTRICIWSHGKPYPLRLPSATHGSVPNSNLQEGGCQSSLSLNRTALQCACEKTSFPHSFDERDSGHICRSSCRNFATYGSLMHFQLFCNGTF